MNDRKKQQTDRPNINQEPSTYLMVATDLSVVSGVATPGEPVLTDKVINKKIYRLLDIFYYCWLRLRIDLAKEAVDAGRIPRLAFDQLCTAFNRIHQWAIQHFDREALTETFIRFDPEGYIPPGLNHDKEPVSSTIFPEEGYWKYVHPVTASALHKVESVKSFALDQGWTEKSLFKNRSNEFRFPYGDVWGLVCFLRPDYRIGKITRECIELVGPKPFENVLRFYNPDVDMPWRSAVVSTDCLLEKKPAEKDLENTFNQHVPVDRADGTMRPSALAQQSKPAERSKLKLMQTGDLQLNLFG